VIESYLVHFEQSPLPHLLQSTNLTRLLLPREENFPIPSLANLSDNMELINLELRPSFPQDYSLATTIRFEFFGIVLSLDTTRSRILIKSSPSILSCRNVAQQLEIIIQEV
jgi:hypothetical protein